MHVLILQFIFWRFTLRKKGMTGMIFLNKMIEFHSETCYFIDNILCDFLRTIIYTNQRLFYQNKIN